MDEHPVDAGTKTEPEVFANTFEIKTSDVYTVDKNVPSRFNNPECFRGYSKKIINPLYQTTNQTYGSKKPTVHEMPTTFNGSRRKFSELHLKSGMYRDNGFNTALDKSRITGPNTTTVLHERANFHYLYHTNGESQ
ncbi:piercer of microtubule wall 2 protein-like [Myxocyprinus asiaticus]|uniref:piercer of microtubule wall 2 protein-like n=1 Tax=Myxocyprinus asiaticus TaxID=70543 RepID=UPI002221A663|nr:piercer of microtubule wall 2 protein-like [Myxocyprinus asiaticus]